ncbi:flavin reductase family protein [Chloroflexota bacterium]
MGKITLGPRMVLGIRPVLLIGANVDGKPNFMTAAASGVANTEPPMISVAIRHNRYTEKGIRQNSTFSVNVPSIDIMKETDYCGIISGTDVDKTEACKFNVFYGKLGSAPLIEQCPINLECQVVHILELDSHSLVIGRVEESHISESCLTEGQPDIDKFKPYIYVTEPVNRYMSPGEVIGKSHSIGWELKK